MSVILAIAGLAGLAGYDNPDISTALRGFDVDYWPTHQVDIGARGTGYSLIRGDPVSHGRTLMVQAGTSYMDDYYFRVHVTPLALVLGNLLTSQSRTVEVWNAFPATGQTLDATVLDDGDGITVTAPGSLPMDFTPMQVSDWTVGVSLDGPPTIDATLAYQFEDASQDATVIITGSRVTAWTYVPDWSNGVTETLSWLTRVFTSTTGAEQRSGVRLSPRATFEFGTMVLDIERTLFDLSVYDAGGRVWALPIFHDIVWLSADLDAGTSLLPAGTGARDFHAGGLAMLRAAETFNYEVVEIDSIDGAGLHLAHPTQQAWPIGSRLYPARLARLAQQPTPLRQTDNWWTSQVQLILAESYDWPAVAPTTSYRGAPVIEDVPDESNDLQMGYERLLQTLDNDTGLSSVLDTAQLGFPVQGHAWLIAGRDAHATLRSLFYYLRGRLKPVWLPTFAQDLKLAAVAGAASTSLDVAWCGYTRFAQQRAGRRDIRIDAPGQAPIYLRITDSVELDAATERLAIDAAPGVELDPGTPGLRISFMALLRLNSDEVVLTHDNAPEGTEGTTTCPVALRALRDDLELA